MDRLASRFNCNCSIPLLFVGDAPDSLTGLGRIGHDLAWLASSMPEFQVGYLGRGSHGRSKFPWTQYSFSVYEQWGEGLIQRAWEDLAQGRKGIIFTVWDASRLLWFADAQATGQEEFLKGDKFERWGYFMADAAGVSPHTLPLEQAHVVSQYHRACFASHWAYELAAFTPTAGVHVPVPELDWIPHPINREVFYPRGREEIRSAWGLDNETALVGCVMANQQRKYWPTVLDAFRRLTERLGSKTRLWIHTDKPVSYWNIPALAVEYGITEQIISETRGLSDTELAMRYSACDATLVISGGEGFCYPVAESLSCGVPCVTGAYGAQAELTHWQAPAVTTVIETSHNVRRAIYTGYDVFNALVEALTTKDKFGRSLALVRHLNMKELGLVWKKWFRKGLQ